MNTLVNAIRTNDKTTENGMATNSTTLSMCVDLFSRVGAMRTQTPQEVINLFVKAFDEDALTAMKILFWARDVRGGAGERRISRDIFKYLAENRATVLAKNLHLIPEFGRWDDTMVLFGTPLEDATIEMIVKALNNKEGLCAKWMPRPNVKDATKKRVVKALRDKLNLSPKEYRKMLVELTNVVETAMCSGDWSSIEYGKIPSKAMSDYMKTFGKHDTDRFVAYLASVEKGEAKINAGAVYPYNVVNSLKQGNTQGANAQWNALPNYLEGNAERLLPVVDVSGSMGCLASGSGSVTCLDVAISLGLYVSERNEGAFKDAFVTFSSNPDLQFLKGSLSDRYNQLSRSQWNMSTNIEKVFKLILDKGIAGNVPQEQMPTMITIFSDMQFNAATSSGWGNSGSDWNPTAQSMIETMYENAGYEVPKLVYWNLHARNGDSPVQFDKQGTALVSGFNVNLLTNLLAGKDLSPYSMMMSTLSNDRYASIAV